jgi:hypothetical protein
VGACFGLLVTAVLAHGQAQAQEEVMDFTGRERPGMVLIDDFDGWLRHRPDFLVPGGIAKAINSIGEGFLDVETALPSPDLAARRPRMTPEILSAMDEWTNEYGRPWSVASYGGPLTPDRMLAHTVRFNTAIILYAPLDFFSQARILKEYFLKDIETARDYLKSGCPGYQSYIDHLLYPDKKIRISTTQHGCYDRGLCNSIIYGWFRRNVSELASLDMLAAISELFAWYHSPDYAPGDLPPEIEAMIEGWKTDSGQRWRNGKYEGKRYEDIKRDLMANLERVNAGELPDAPEAGVADYGTMLFLIATGRLLSPLADEGTISP